MATSKKEPPYPSSRDRATRMSPNLRPSSSESSSSYGPRRAWSVPSSPDRKFDPSAAALPASTSPNMYHHPPSSSLAGRSISSQTMSSSGSSIHGSKPSPGVASKPMLARTKSATSQRPPALAVPPSNSFKDTAKTAARSKSPSTLLKTVKSKLSSPRPCTDKAVASPKPSTQRVPSPGAVRGGKTLLVSSSARAPAAAAAAKKRAEAQAATNGGGGAAASSRARSVPQRAMEPSATRKEKEEEPSMLFEESESLSAPSIEDHLHEQLPDPVDLNSMDMAATGSARRYQQVAYSDDHLEQQGESEGVKERSEKEDAGCSELSNGGQDADASGKNKAGMVNAADELERAEKEKAKAAPVMDRTELAQSWRKDDLKSNDMIEETKSKLLEERKSRVKALVGAFETVMSFKE